MQDPDWTTIVTLRHRTVKEEGLGGNSKCLNFEMELQGELKDRSQGKTAEVKHRTMKEKKLNENSKDRILELKVEYRVKVLVGNIKLNWSP